ncbi:MAG: Mrp/NBP35 family ATP-binding protein [Planctomycetes bacterium]|nr:Mrp/NBP35 family ATP-binding protein [Planctomycetota bacterium]
MNDRTAALRQALSTVQDPDLHKDLVTLDMVRDLAVDGDCARFRLVLTTSACPMKQQIEDQCRAAALTVPGVARVELEVTAEVPKGVRLSDQLPGVRHIIGVGSGKGGVGKSTVAANLACALARGGARVGLLDADIYGPSVPIMFGIHDQPQVVDKKLQPPVAHGVRLMSMGFLIDPDQPVVWRGPMLMGALRQFLTDVAWGELDYLLVDLPPGTGDIQITLAQSVSLAGAVVVSTPQAVALADVRRSVMMFHKVEVPVFGIVENMSEFVCPQCGHAEPIFGRGGAETEASQLAVPFLGRIPLEPGVRVAGDGGVPVVISHPHSRSAQAFALLAEKVAQQVSIAALRR